MSPNPIFPGGQDDLKALSPVLELLCCDTKAIYDKEKAERRKIEFSDLVGEPFRKCAATAYQQILTSECKDIMVALVKCNKKNENSYSYKCKSVRDSLVQCAMKNKMGELGQNFME